MRLALLPLLGLLVASAAPAALVELPAGTPPPPLLDLGQPGTSPVATLPSDFARVPVGSPPPESGRALPPLPAATPAAAAAAGSAAILALVIFLYSRLARGQLLDHKRRERMLALVKERPGIPLTEVAQELGMGWGATVYHVDRLEKAGFVTSERANGRRCLFPVGETPRADRVPITALQQETTRCVADYVAKRPGATQGDLCADLGLSASAASKQVSKLESVGLVRRERANRGVLLHPSPSLAALLAPRAARA